MTQLSFAEYMRQRLYGSQGYYAQGTGQSGRSGDYFTAAETGNAFGALLTEWFLRWQEHDDTEPFSLVEAGAGEGKLAYAIGDALKERHPDRAHLFEYYAVEVGDARRRALVTNLPHFPCPAKALGSLKELHGRAVRGCLFANELIDALPVHKVRWVRNRLEEGYVISNGSGAQEWSWGKPSTPKLAAYLNRLRIKLADGQEAEINLSMAEWLKDASRALRAGVVVLIDYGRSAAELFDPARSHGTLRGFKDHKVVSDVLAADQALDLTADVDFTSLAYDALAAGFKVVGFMELGSFLIQVAEGLKPPLPKGLRYLIHPEGMGASFHVLLLAKGQSFLDVPLQHNRLNRLGLKAEGT